MRDPRPPRRRPDSRTARPAGAKRDPVRTVARTAESSRATPSVLRDLRRDALAIFQHALESVDPERAVTEALHLDGDRLSVSGNRIPIDGGRSTHILAIGKASMGMSKGALRLLRPDSGLLVAQEIPSSPPGGFEVVRASHPLPDQGSLQAGEAAMRLIDRLGPGDLLLVLLSGGASALFEATSVPLDDLRTATVELLRSGLAIRDVNEVRKGLSKVKGGRLAERASARGATVVGLILSDIVGNPIDDIGSGPTTLHSSRGERAKSILERHRLWDSMPATVQRVLRSAAESPEVRSSAPSGAVYNVIVADNGRACEAARQEAERRGYASHVLTTAMEGEARQVGPVVVSQALRWNPAARSVAVIAGGETTVTVRGGGRGGRNQELALSAAGLLEGRRAVLLACGTDCPGGKPEAAGAIVDGRTMARASALGLNPEEFLDNNDAYSFFRSLRDLVVTGPTGTNVADLVLFLAHRPGRDRRERLSRSSGRGRASSLGSPRSDSAHRRAMGAP